MIFFFLGFFLGAIAVIAVEGLVLLKLLQRLSRGRTVDVSSKAEEVRDLDAEQSLNCSSDKKGVIWVLETEKILIKASTSKAPTDQRNKKERVEVSPVKKIGEIKDHSLILMESDGTRATIQLVDCIIVAVSASSLSSKKWAKRYPIKIENKDSAIYNGSNILFIYLETSWEKESWCKALRLASCTDRDKINNRIILTKEFCEYLSSLNEEYPYFMKPAAVSGDIADRGISIDNSSSRVRHFLKKIAKKASKSSAGYKINAISSFALDERKADSQHKTSVFSKTLSDKVVRSSSDGDLVPSFPLLSNDSVSQGEMSIHSDMDGDEKISSDEGTLCWNLLFARLFFDSKRSTELNNFIHTRIQRTLSNMRTPSYIGGITCTRVDIGKVPPFIRSMRVLPTDLKEVWSMEIDFEYSGGAILYIETRLEVCEGIENTDMEPSIDGEASSDLLESLECNGDELKQSGDSAGQSENRGEGDKLDGMNSKNTRWKSRWKCVLNSLAGQVSQVPLSLAVKITSLRGTLRLYVKSPPSDCIWFAFKTLPDIDWNLESAVGEHKITSSHIALLISNRFKTAIRETLVLPNCESICIPAMIAEKDDWIPCKDAPFIWVRQDTDDLIRRNAANSKIEDTKTKESMNKANKQSGDFEKSNELMHTEPLPTSNESTSLPGNSSQSLESDFRVDLTEPLLKRDETREDSPSLSRAESQEGSLVPFATSEEMTPIINDDSKLKKVGRRAKMLDLGKKMGEKLEEKRRHIEERSRHIVEKMKKYDN